MKEHYSQWRGILAACALVCLACLNLNAADLGEFVAAKGERWIQTNAGPVVPASPSNHVFIANGEPGGVQTLTNLVLTVPGGPSISFAELEYPPEHFFTNRAALDVAFPNGAYVVTSGGINDGPRTNVISITGDAYPGTPTIGNFAAAQSIDPELDFNLTWAPISGAQPTDFIIFEIEDCRGEGFAGTPSPGKQGALAGTATNHVIRARTLRPGQQYKARLTVVRLTTFDTNSYAGATLLGGYFKELFLPIKTVGTSSGCPAGSFQLTFEFPPGGLDGTNGVMQFPVSLDRYSANLFLQGEGPFPPGVTFTGPLGSGLNNTSNAHAHVDFEAGSYGSPAVSVPPFPPGGLYSVNGGGPAFNFGLLDPHAAQQQVILLPTAVLNVDGIVTEIRWRYVDTNGVTIAEPPPFIAEIYLELIGASGPVYSSHWSGSPILPVNTSHLPSMTVPWVTVMSVRTGFRDVVGNQFGAHFGGGGAPALEIVTQTLPPGNVGAPYSFGLQAVGGTAPYIWSVQAGLLPEGMILSQSTGEITGTPSIPGTVEFVIRVTDMMAQFVDRSFILHVNGDGNPGNTNLSDVRLYGVAKSARWMQTNAVSVVAVPGSNHLFFAFADATGPQALSQVTVYPPTKPAVGLFGESEDSFNFETLFASQSLLDVEFPNGDYAFVTVGARDGERTNYLALLNDGYPSTPQLSNFDAAQAIDPTADFSLEWGNLSAATPVDFLSIEIEDCAGQHLFSTPGPGRPDALNGTATNHVILARSLRPGQSYKVKLLAAHFSTFDTNSYPGAIGLAAYVHETVVMIRTTGTPVNCVPGDLAFVFNFPTGGIDGTNGVLPFPTALEYYGLHYFTRGEPNIQATVQFTGPGGSGLSNSVSFENRVNDNEAFYGSVLLGVPPFPPGGVYSVQFGPENRMFNLLDPNAANQQIVLLPTVLVNESGSVEEIRWRFTDTFGMTVPPPPFVQSISFTLHSTNGPLYQVGAHDMPLLGDATSHRLHTQVPWNMVTRIELVFRDPARNTYVSTFNRGVIEPPPGLEIVNAALLSGDVGVNYSYTMEATGGDFPYFWSIAGGGLPPGLTIDELTGEISGIPNQAGSFGFTVRVTDSMEATDELRFTLGIRPGNTPAGPEVREFGLFKGQGFMQLSPAAPVPDTNELFHFEAFVDSSTAGVVTNATLRSPKGTNYPMELEGMGPPPSLARAVGGEGEGEGEGEFEPHGDTFHHSRNFNTKAAMDNFFGSGTYTFLIGTVTSNRTVTLNLPGDAYPATPRVSNWQAAQAIDAFNDFVLTWEPLPGATTNDLLMVEIEDENGFVFSSSDAEGPGLNGRSTACVIPAGFLEGGREYKGAVMIYRPVVLNTNGIPGAKGIGAYAKATFFPLHTVTPPPPQGQIQFSAASYSVGETGMVAQFTITRTGGTEGAVSVHFTTSDGTAFGDLDYEPTTGPIELADGEAEASFTFPVFDDDVFETNETVRMSLSNPEGGATLGTLTNAIMVITDNDQPGTAGLLQFSVASVPVGESSSAVTLTVTRTDGRSGEVTVDYSTDDGSAEGELDYAPTTGTVTLGNNVASRTFTIGIVNDDLDETNESFTVALSNPGGGASLGSRNVATVTIADNDTAGEIRFSATAYRVSETNEEAVITITRSGGVAGGVTVELVYTDLTATRDEDYMPSIETIEFPPGETTTNFAILIGGDSDPEGDETFRLDLTNPTGGATLGRGTNATVTIIDDEESLQLSAEAYSVSEGAPTVMLTVNRFGPATGSVSVDYSTGSGTAGSDEDFLGTNGTITLGPGVKTKSFPVRIIRDDLVEEDETFGVELGNPIGALLGNITEALVTIVDDDEGGAISFRSAGFTVREQNPVAIINVTRTDGRAGDVTVELETSDGTAESGDDYASVATTIAFSAGETSKRIEIPIINDAFDETNETVLLTLSNPTGGGTLGEVHEAVLTIIDNDNGGVITFSAASYSTTETGITAIVTLMRTGGTAEGASVDFVTAGGTAIPDDDFTAVTNTFLFESNQTKLNIEIDVADDELPDGNKTVLLALSNPGGGARLGTRSTSVLNIQDTELSVQFTNVTFTVIEGVRSAVIGVRRSGPPRGTVTVSYATDDRTATLGSDYTARAGVLSFSATSTLKTITVPILNDTTSESAETFAITLSNPTGGAVLGDNDQIIVTIQDNDPAPRVTRRIRP